MRVDPSQIGRPAGAVPPAPQGGETAAGAEMCECPCGAPIPGCDAHFCDDCAAGPPMTVDELYAFAEDLMDQSWFDMRNVEAFERGKKLAVLARALAQPPRPAAVADEDVREAVECDPACEPGCDRNVYGLGCNCARGRCGTCGTPLERVCLACGRGLFTPDDLREAEAQLQGYVVTEYDAPGDRIPRVIRSPDRAACLRVLTRLRALAAPAPRDPARDAAAAERAVADADVRTPVPAPDWSPVCPHCQRIIWQAVPELSRARDYVEARGRVTARDIADAFDWSIQNAHNKLRRLESLGVLKCDGAVALPGGGRAFIFAARRAEPGEGAHG